LTQPSVCASIQLSGNLFNCVFLSQVEEERLDESVVNLHLCGLPSDVGVGSTLPRGSERLSLTVRRVEKVVKNVIKLGAH
jgi:hypothetical protein